MNIFKIEFDDDIINFFDKFSLETKKDIINFFKPIMDDEFGGFPICYTCVSEVITYSLLPKLVLLFEMNYYDDGIKQTVTLDLIGFVDKKLT